MKTNSTITGISGTDACSSQGLCDWAKTAHCREPVEVTFESGLGYCRADARSVQANREWLPGFSRTGNSQSTESEMQKRIRACIVAELEEVVMWQWIVTHRADVELVAGCWLAVQIASGMPTPRDTSNTAYKWAFNVAHSVTNLPRLLATAFPEVSWIAALFGVPAEQAKVKAANNGQTNGGGSAR